MTYDDCEAYEAQQAEERAGRLCNRWAELYYLARDAAGGIEPDVPRLYALLPLLDALECGEDVKTAPIYAELGEIRRELETNRTEAS